MKGKDVTADDASLNTTILHYHLFKNAGTSVDAILKANFPAAWRNREFHDVPAAAIPAAVQRWLETDRDGIAFSSHTALGPVPRIDGMQVFSLLFLRHPIDRIRSAYQFERKQNAQTLGSILARQGSFADYVLRLLDTPNERSLRNFQTLRLSHFQPDATRPELDRALDGLNQLSLVGLVERFSDSMAAFREILRPCFPDFFTLPVRENTSGMVEGSLDERLEITRAMLGNAAFDALVSANADDARLHAEACKRFERRFGPGRVAA